MTVTDSELDFVSPFLVTAQRDVRLGALTLYFDTLFEAGCQTTVVLDTSPFVPATHWKQTLLFLADPLMLRTNDVVRGDIRLTRPAKYPRGYDIVLTYALNGGDSRIQMYEMY
jgi:hypothetical protein